MRRNARITLKAKLGMRKPGPKFTATDCAFGCSRPGVSFSIKPSRARFLSYNLRKKVSRDQFTVVFFMQYIGRRNLADPPC